MSKSKKSSVIQEQEQISQNDLNINESQDEQDEKVQKEQYEQKEKNNSSIEEDNEKQNFDAKSKQSISQEKLEKHPQTQKRNSALQQETFQKQGSIQSREDVIWKAYDFLFPSGRIAKLIKVFDISAKIIPYNDMLFKLKMMEGSPVVNFIGAKDTNRGKFFGGIARACFNTDAVIVDNGMTSGVEKYALRRGVKLIGVGPEKELMLPKQNSPYIDPYEISNGHTHLFLLNNREIGVYWGMEATFKMDLCRKIAEGRMQKSGQKDSFKIVNILFGETDNFMSELQLAVLYNLPILVVRGSPICNEYFNNLNNPKAIYSEPCKNSFGPLVKKGHFYGINSLDSEDIAQYLHFFLTVKPY